MESPGEIFQWRNFAAAKFLCRLCLALNNQVKVPIFGEKSDIRQISLKISSCLPVKIAADDLLPKNICQGCLDKLELFYTFWNSSQEAEKKLWAWVQQISINNEGENTSAVAKQIANSEAIGPTTEVKEKTEDGHDIVVINYLFDDEDVGEKEPEEAPSPKRARLSPTVKEDIISLLSDSDDDENDVDKSKPLTRVEDESDMNNSEQDESHSSFVDLRDTSVDEQQFGPSGVGKGRLNAPFNLCVKEEIEIVEENLLEKIRQAKEDKEVEEDENAFNKQNGEQQPKIKFHYYDKPVIREYSIKFHETGKEIGQKGYKCHLCSAIYSRNSHLTVHYRDKHSKHKTKYTCEICSREYFFKNSLKTHIQKHRQKFSCSICPKMYTLKHKLQEHENIHSKEVEYRCEVCGEIFWLLDAFKNHCNKMHQCAEILKCDKCHNKFTQNILLNIHKKKYHSNLINY